MYNWILNNWCIAQLAYQIPEQLKTAACDSHNGPFLEADYWLDI